MPICKLTNHSDVKFKTATSAKSALNAFWKQIIIKPTGLEEHEIILPRGKVGPGF